jgi:hypothetical protein
VVRDDVLPRSRLRGVLRPRSLSAQTCRCSSDLRMRRIAPNRQFAVARANRRVGVESHHSQASCLALSRLLASRTIALRFSRVTTRLEAAVKSNFAPGLHVAAGQPVNVSAYDGWTGRWSRLFLPGGDFRCGGRARIPSTPHLDGNGRGGIDNAPGRRSLWRGHRCRYRPSYGYRRARPAK